MSPSPRECQEFLTISQTAHWLTISDAAGADSGFPHTALGPHNIPGAYCDNCDAPLHRLLSLDVRDPILNLPSLPFPWLHLLLCPSCGGGSPDYSYAIREDDSIVPLARDHGGGQSPYDDYPLYFPARSVSFIPVTPTEQEIIWEFNQRGDNYDLLCDLYQDTLGEIRHQFAGEPFLIQLTQNPPCPLCGKTMPFVVAVADDIAPSPGFLDNCGIQMLFYLCPACAVISSIIECD